MRDQDFTEGQNLKAPIFHICFFPTSHPHLEYQSSHQVYATRAPAATPATWASIMKLVKETRTHPKPLPYLQQQLAVGWGTARVAVGMALGSSVYERSKSALEKVL